LTYRMLSRAEIDEYKAAESYCFMVPPDVLEPYFQHKIKQEHTRGIVGPDGTLQVALTNYPFSLYIGGAKLGMGGIAGVVSWPEYRRGGLVGEMLRQCLRETREQGMPLSGLYPFKQSFYRQFGWEVAAAWVQHEIPVDLLRQFPRLATGVLRRYAPCEDNWAALATVYAKYASARRGYIVRETKEYWDAWINPPWAKPDHQWHVALWRPSAVAEPEGYLLYRLNKNDQGQWHLAIKELVALTLEAQQSLWGFVAQHDSQVKRVEIRLPREYPLWHLVENTHEVKSELKSGWMLRLADLKAAFEQRPWAGVPNGSLTLAVKDGQAPWNAGTWRIAFESGQVSVGKAEAEIADLSTDVGTLSALYAGFYRPEQCVTSGRLACSDAGALRLLAQAFAGEEMWYYEYY